jgi:CHAP domain
MLLFNRRRFVSHAICASTVAMATPSYSAQNSCSDYERLSFQPPTIPSETKVTGDENPASAEISRAFKILMNAPQDSPPIEVAAYFAKLAAKSVYKYKDKSGRSEQRLYREEWPTPGIANPLIVGFFGMTQYLPSGDTTPWCAAFANFCLWKSGFLGTDNAAAASFRPLLKSYSQEGEPQTGDLAVFQDKDNENHGHVAFFVTVDDIRSKKFFASDEVVKRYSEKPTGRLYCLGGNQSSAGSTGGVKISVYGRDESKRLLGFIDVKKLKKISALE